MQRHGEQAVEVLDLEADPEAVGRARQFVAALLDRWEVIGLGPDASLVTSELVSNAVIHARTPIEVRVAPHDDGIRVEVRDGAAYGIVVRPPDDHLTPRGLGLRVVAQLATRWGVDPTPDGKTVWAELSPAHLGSGPVLPEMTVGPAPVPLPGDWPEVQLQDVPTELLVRWEQHLRDLRREFAVAAPHRRPLEELGPQDPLELVVATLDRYWDLVRPIWARARPVGEPRPGYVSVVVQLPDRVAVDGPRFLNALDAADELSRRGVLLTEPPPDDVVAFRRSFVNTLVRQVNAARQSGSSTS
ncbi:MAG TPA: ATP-binding protein [Acidimicrobiales bacterium]|nr:ATP-binding protein [Acidimicrobiales bacterium]